MVWRVVLVLDSGERVEDVVIAERATDACVVLGDEVRRRRGVEPGGYIGIEQTDAYRVADSRAGEAFNR